MACSNQRVPFLDNCLPTNCNFHLSYLVFFTQFLIAICLFHPKILFVFVQNFLTFETFNLITNLCHFKLVTKFLPCLFSITTSFVDILCSYAQGQVYQLNYGQQLIKKFGIDYVIIIEHKLGQHNQTWYLNCIRQKSTQIHQKAFQFFSQSWRHLLMDRRRLELYHQKQGKVRKQLT